ncbi:probable pectin lyase D isoform X1 [Thrips palmi]|uniref:pectin lyase n=1 Tax=Thrips palmi TaxID=161013 RepID=A0A6P9A916_THRPL|nr:probable pectin lyase D isoform X1 [Thrips palmi]
MNSLLLLVCLLPATALAGGWNRNCITKPVGFGYKTTGGQGGETVTPKNINELKSYLGSNQKLIIVLDRTYDFTNSEGWATSTGCYFQKCGSGFQESLAHAGTCNGKSSTNVKYAKAGTTEIVIGSNKSIIGKNGKGVIKGKGLRIKNAQNVIIRDISITDINPQVIWAGDAMAFDNAQNVWVQGVTFARIGRQHLVSYQNQNKGITVSSCLFDGTSKNSALCDGAHYWVWLFWGTHDEITLINNHVLNTAGRTPHAGGWGKAQPYIHLIGNYMDQNPHTGIEPKTGSYILAEGNIFKKFSNVVDPEAKGGHLALVNDAKQAAICKKYFGQNCKVNSLQNSKSKTWFDESVLSAFSKLDKNAINGARAASCLI